MAAGLGFKDFTTGEVLTAADVDGYLMQGIWVFANSAARDAAVTSPQEGNFAFLKDTNTTTYYTGSAWTNLDTTGMVNPMTTTGDTIYSSSGSTPARLGIGTAGQVLTVNSGATAPQWSTPAGGGANWSLLNTGGTALTGAATVTVSGISGADKIMIIVIGASGDSNPRAMRFRFNTDTGNNYVRTGFYIATSGSYQSSFMEGEGQTNSDAIPFGVMGGNNASVVNGYCLITGCNSSGVKVFTVEGAGDNGGSNGNQSRSTGGIYNSSSVISSISVNINGGNLDAGTVYVYTSA